MRNTAQREIRFPVSWGGRRKGAGRKPGPNPRVAHLSRERFARRFPCHVTLKVRHDVPSLRLVKVVREVEATFRTGRERKGFRLVHYSLQSNHAHLVVEATNREVLGRGMKAIGARLARAVNRACRRRGPVLADRYHLRVLRTPREVRNALAYVLLNGRRHAHERLGKRLGKGRVDPASSGRWFDGWRGHLGASARDPAAVAAPHTWLLGVGWRRHGLLRLDEVPGGRGG